MPRKPKRHNQCLRYRPLTFSPFARTIAMAASSQRARRGVHEEDKDLPTSSANGFINNGKGKVELSDSSDDEEFEGVVQADFVFFDPKHSDFHGVKVLLQKYLDNKLWDLSGFVDLILGQPTVGTVVKIENDEDDGVYSVVTALNLGRYKDSKCILELKDFLLKVCQGRDVIANLRSLVWGRAQDVGLLISQRVVNLPPQLLPPLYDALFDEVEWAIEDEVINNIIMIDKLCSWVCYWSPLLASSSQIFTHIIFYLLKPTEDLQNSFRFKFYLIISKIYKHKNADQNKGKIQSGEEPVIYVKPEDELFFELSLWSFSFPLHAEQVTSKELKNYQAMGLVMAVEASKVSTFRKQLHSLIDE